MTAFPQPLRDGTGLVFVVGAPRSGTTWVQLLLAQHPEVATSQETHLFARLLGRVAEAWERDREDPGERDIGLRPWLDETEFHGWCRSLASTVLERIRATRPGARVVVEKTPSHVFHAGTILELFPEARFVHVIRDPRAVVTSLRHAGESWGGRWAPTGATAASEVWTRHVRAGLALRRLTDRVHEVRYESLADDTDGELRSLLEFVELEGSEAFRREAVEACSLDRLRTSETTAYVPWALEAEPDGFFRRGDPEAWRDELSTRQRGIVEAVGGQLMEELGYEPSVSPAWSPLTVRAHAFLDRLRNGLDWHLRRLLVRF